MALLLENYEHFVKENGALIEENTTEFLKNEPSFREYIESLTEAIEDPEARESFKKVAYREREFLLTEAASLLNGEGKAWAIMYFPILADAYSTPSIMKLLTPFTTANARVALPRRIIKGDIVNIDGSTSTVVLPSTQAVRPNKITATVSLGRSNILDSITLPAGAKASINRRYFIITKVNVTETDGTNTVNKEVKVAIKPGFNGNFSGIGTFTTEDGKVATVYISGSVNYETGDIIINGSVDPNGSANTITIDNVVVEARIRVVGADLGKVKLRVDVDDNTEIIIDEDNEFEIELTDETIQDLKDIYDIDALAVLSEVVKLQFQLNKDADIADVLKVAEPEMAAVGNTSTADLTALPSGVTPANVPDVYSFVVPHILKVAKNIEKVAHVSPQYLVTDRETAIVLEMLQSYGIQAVNGNAKVGPISQALQFTKFNIVVSDSVERGKIYVVYKAMNKANAALVDLVYKPLYVHKSDVNGVAKQYLKSRTAVELVDSRKVGVVNVIT